MCDNLVKISCSICGLLQMVTLIFRVQYIDCCHCGVKLCISTEADSIKVTVIGHPAKRRLTKGAEG